MEVDDRTLNNVMTIWFSELLDLNDDAEFWQVALNHILSEVEKDTQVFVEVGHALTGYDLIRAGGRLTVVSLGPPGTAAGMAVTATRHSLSSIGRSFLGGPEPVGIGSNGNRSGILSE